MTLTSDDLPWSPEQELMHFRQCLLGSPVILAITDTQLRYTWIHNPHPEFDAGTVLGRTDTEIADNAGTRVLRDLKQRVLTERTELREEVEFPLDGGRRVYEVIAAPLLEGEQCVGVRSAAFDVTERREAQEALQRLRAEQIRLLSHDLRQPLDAIGLNARVVSHLDPRTAEVGERIHAGVRQMTRALEDVLDAAEFRLGQLTLHCESADLGDLVRSAVEVGVAVVEQPRIHIESARPCVVHVDRVKLTRAVLNVVGNALKFSTEGIAIAVVRDDSTARISVRDGGPGLEPEDAATVFEPHRASAHSRAHGGKGLGLYSTRLIVEAHGGACGVDSKPGRGSTFYLELPLD